MARAVLGLGGNLGARRALLDCARTLLVGQPGLRVGAVSRLYHTAPLGPPQPDYLNAALALEWAGTPRSLLAITQHVETLLRRQRAERWGPRTLDLDILHWGGGAVDEPGLHVPHPELTRRPFALVPLAEVAPELPAQLGLAPEAVDPGFAHSEPFARPLQRASDGSLEFGPSSDPLELASGFLLALSWLLAPARGTWPGAPTVLPFVCPLPGATEIEPTALLEPLQQRLLASARHGFFAQNAAITGVREGRCEGVFVGVRCAPLNAPPSVRWDFSPGVPGGVLRLNRA